MATERLGDLLITLASEDDTARPGTFLDVLFSLAVWLTCLVSGWATYIGFSVDLPKLVALVLAVAIALFLTGSEFRAAQTQARGNEPLGNARDVVDRRHHQLPGEHQRDLLLSDSPRHRRPNAGRSLARLRLGDEQGLARDRRGARRRRARGSPAQPRRRTPELAEHRSSIRETRASARSRKATTREVTKILGVDLTPLRAPEPTAPTEELAAYASRLDAFIEEQAATQFKNDPAAPFVALQDEHSKR